MSLVQLGATIAVYGELQRRPERKSAELNKQTYPARKIYTL